MHSLITNDFGVPCWRTSLLSLRDWRPCYFGPSRPSWCQKEVDTDGLLTPFPYGVGFRDCLAAAGTDGAAINGGGAGGGFTKSKTCYKCQQEGHVCRPHAYSSHSWADPWLPRHCRLPVTALRTLSTLLEVGFLIVATAGSMNQHLSSLSSLGRRIGRLWNAMKSCSFPHCL